MTDEPHGRQAQGNAGAFLAPGTGMIPAPMASDDTLGGAPPEPDDPAQPLTDPLTGEAITEIAWAPEDGLPFPLCISSVTDSDHDEVYLANVTVARGNMVLADHGFTRLVTEVDINTWLRQEGLLQLAPAGPTADAGMERTPDLTPLVRG